MWQKGYIEPFSPVGFDQWQARLVRAVIDQHYLNILEVLSQDAVQKMGQAMQMVVVRYDEREFRHGQSILIAGLPAMRQPSRQPL